MFDLPVSENQAKFEDEFGSHKGTELKCCTYRIIGIFCSYLIFAVYCGSIEIAEIKNRKIFQSRYNDDIVSEVFVQSRIFRCPSGIVVELTV